MVNNKNFGKILVIVLLFSISIGGCELFEEEDFSGVINGTWYHYNYSGSGGSYQKTGSIIIINDGVGTLTAIGNNDNYKYYSNLGDIKIGDIILKNINYHSEKKDYVYWTCDSIFSYVYGLNWEKQYISYNKKEKEMFVYTVGGDPDFGGGLGYSYRK
jgi:hypothetical protein